jgi:hypothetical protein
MATNNYTTLISHAATANFRAWGLAFSNALTAVGFIKSADTGQINWASVNKSGSTDTAAGYEIRYLNDSLHGTAPIYVKIEYGNGVVHTYPSIWITVGTGSNGSGTITGIFVARVQCYSSQFVLDSTVLAKQTYACMVEGCVWFALKCNVVFTSGAVSGLVIHRTVDSSGTPTAQGVVVYVATVTVCPSVTTYEFTTGYTWSSTDVGIFGCNAYAFMPGLLGTSGTIHAGVPGDYQVARHYCAMPLIQPLSNVVSLSSTDGLTLGTTFTCTTLGVTPKTFIVLENNMSWRDYFGLIWE